MGVGRLRDQECKHVDGEFVKNGTFFSDHCRFKPVCKAV